MVLQVDDDSETGSLGACCGNCQNAQDARPRFVIGVFMDLEGANGVAEKLRCSVGPKVNVLSSSDRTLSQDLIGTSAQSMAACSRLYQQITRHLASGAAIVVVDAQTPEQQLGASRILLESKCDMLVTHDGQHPTD